VARQCTICTHENARELDALLLRNKNGTSPGMSLSMIATRFDCSVQSLSRHRRLHLSMRILHSLRVTETTSSTDLIEGLTEALADLSLMRSSSLMSGQTALAIRATTELRSLSEYLIGIGLTDSDLTKELRFGQHLASAVAHAVRDHPEVVGAISAALRNVGETDAADDLELVAANATPTTQELETRNDF
jgi:hypothetical protein